jgi:hypothetical protein
MESGARHQPSAAKADERHVSFTKRLTDLLGQLRGSGERRAKAPGVTSSRAWISPSWSFGLEDAASISIMP